MFVVEAHVWKSLTVPMIVVVVVVVSTCSVADGATLLLATGVFSVVVHFLTFIGNRAHVALKCKLK